MELIGFFFISMCNKFGTPFVLELERRPSPIIPKGSPKRKSPIEFETIYHKPLTDETD